MGARRDQPALDRRIAQLAAAQHGVVTRRQLETLGAGRGAVEHRLATGRLHALHRGVYAVGHTLVGAEGRWLAAVLRVGGGAALSHGCAGAHWGFRPTESARIHVTIASRAGRLSSNGIVVHRSSTLRDGDLVRHRGIPVTSPARTLLDLAGHVHNSALERAVERAEALRLFDLGAVRAAIRAYPNSRGVAALRTIVDEGFVADPPRSELEDRFLALCREHGIPRPLVNVRVAGYEVDFLWPRERVIVETDGRETHATRAAFERDRARDAGLTVAGYRVLRFTYLQVTRAPRLVAGQVRSLLEDSTDQTLD